MNAILAVFGPVLTVLVVVWERFHDRSNLVVQLDVEPKSGHGSAFVVTVNNKGKRPVTVRDATLRLKGGGTFSYTRETVYRKLEDADGFTFGFEWYHLCDRGFHPLDAECVEVRDVGGRVYSAKLSRRDRQQAQQIWARSWAEKT